MDFLKLIFGADFDPLISHLLFGAAMVGIMRGNRVNSFQPPRPTANFLKSARPCPARARHGGSRLLMSWQTTLLEVEGT